MLIATTTMTYDAIGNLLTLDGPLPGTADTTRYRYDAGRALIGTVGPDPDGSNPHPHRAVRTVYGTSGEVSAVEVGTVADQSDSAWAAMSVYEKAEIAYDANLRPLVRRLVAGTTTYALTQTSYDALGRAECTAQRMNPAEYASLPSSACALDTAGGFGPDRITRTLYDAAGRVYKVRTALNTALENDDLTQLYTANGRTSSVIDGEDNLTHYTYDGHDRPARTYYPSATQGAGTFNAADYEQLGYDAGSNVTSRRLRDGKVLGFSYDALNRLTYADNPDSSGGEVSDVDVTYAYDNIGRLLSATDSNGHYNVQTYDALGRLMQADPIGYRGGMNLYAYVLGDPVNYVDPLGLVPDDCPVKPCSGEIILTGTRLLRNLLWTGRAALIRAKPGGPDGDDRGPGGDRESDEGCPAVPPGGPGKAALDDAIADAEKFARLLNPGAGPVSAALNAQIIAAVFKTGGKWDVKSLRDDTGRSMFPQGRDFGNFLYGAATAAAGYTPGLSNLAADIYSLYTNGTLEEEDAIISAEQKYYARGRHKR